MPIPASTWRWGDFNPHAPCGARHSADPADDRSETDFNPRAPCGARHRAAEGAGRGMAISIRRAPCGARPRHRRPPALQRYFNPRAPYGARPWRGPHSRRPGRYFNPRAPYGARPRTLAGLRMLSGFQSSRPLRGATAKIHKNRVCFCNNRQRTNAFPPSSAACQDAF